jgi:shikimate kinase
MITSANCIVLLGFSTTGKSSILRDFKEEFEDAIDTIDSDAWLAKDYDSHIYNVYLRLRKEQDTRPAIDFIAQREREFLTSMNPCEKPTLLAAGPFLSSHGQEWSRFLERVNPICFYLEKEAEHVLCGLLERHYRHRQKPQIAEDPGFGCWDEGSTTDFSEDRWVLLPWKQALENTRNNMAGVIDGYLTVAKETFTWWERMTSDGQARLTQSIKHALNL